MGVDPFGGFFTRLTVMVHPGLDKDAGRAGLAALSATGRDVSIVRDAPAPVAQRLLASIVNVGCGIAEQRLARPQDIDTAVRLGLGYPRGPLEWGEHEGANRILQILRGLHETTGDPRYRPSTWLTERAMLGLPSPKPAPSPPTSRPDGFGGAVGDGTAPSTSGRRRPPRQARPRPAERDAPARTPGGGIAGEAAFAKG